MSGQPNVVIITVGRTGSALLVRMAAKLGWNIGDAHPYYGEPMEIENTQWQFLHGNASRAALKHHIRRHLDNLQSPWCVKSCRIAECWDVWKPILREMNVTLVWSDRDDADVLESWRRAGWGHDLGLLDRRREQVEAAFADWDGAKIHLHHEDVCAAAGLVRVGRRAGGDSRGEARDGCSPDGEQSTTR